MFRDMHLRRNNQLARLHERLARELNRQRMDDNDRRLEALKANDFEAYKELLKQTYGPLSDDDRFAGARFAASLVIYRCSGEQWRWCLSGIVLWLAGGCRLMPHLRLLVDAALESWLGPDCGRCTLPLMR